MTIPGPSILIVDDEPQNRRLLEALLHPEGYVTRTASSGAEALASIGEDPPDLILLDVMMPLMDGHQVAALLKADPATRGIPIVMVTAQTDRAARLAALEAGAEDFLTKPIDRAELWLRVRNHLRLKELNDLLSNHRDHLEAQVLARTSDLQYLAHYDPPPACRTGRSSTKPLRRPSSTPRRRAGPWPWSSSTSTTSRTSTTPSGTCSATSCWCR